MNERQTDRGGKETVGVGQREEGVEKQRKGEARDSG